MTWLQILLLFITAVCGGALNSVAGGGTFFTFPSLLFVGVLPIPANATSTAALLPGGLASVGAYRRELVKIQRVLIILLVATSLVGGVMGATLLLHTSQAVFSHLVPYLLFIATMLFAFSGGQSILIMTALALMGIENIHEINALKTLLASSINSVAVITFIIGQAIVWPLALLMAAGAIVGGYDGAYFARKIDQKWIRLFVILVGAILTTYFFIKST